MVMFNIKNVKKISFQKIKDFKIYIFKKITQISFIHSIALHYAYIRESHWPSVH